MKQITFLIMSMFTYIPIIATAGETAEEYADTEKITVIDGGVSISGTQRMGYVCKDTLYPGTNRTVPEWLLMQFDQAEQDNPDYPESTIFREVWDTYKTPPPYHEYIKPGREEECVERARIFIENIHKAVADNIQNLGNPNYVPFRIAQYSFSIKKRERLRWWGGNKLARRNAVEFTRRVYYEVQSKFQNMNYACRDFWYPNTHLPVPLWLEIQLLWAERNNPYYKNPYLPEFTLFRQVEEEYGGILAHADPIIPGEKYVKYKCIERADIYAGAIREAVRDNILYYPFEGVTSINSSGRGGREFLPFDIDAYSARVKAREQLNQLDRVLEKYD